MGKPVQNLAMPIDRKLHFRVILKLAAQHTLFVCEQRIAGNPSFMAGIDRDFEWVFRGRHGFDVGRETRGACRARNSTRKTALHNKYLALTNIPVAIQLTQVTALSP